ncbi:MAG: proteasome assembly chaperone family protein [Euryarchaeota archaeon]|nr:proteasome assembly chaperone family protein [Euryarchaeota archaeon]
MSEDIKIYELSRVDLKDATVIDGFPSVGLVSSIVANYLINVMKMRQIAIMDSVYFPTVSLVRDSIPMHPVRIYASDRMGSDDNTEMLVVFISEFQPPPNLVKPIAQTMIDWAEDQKCKMLLSPEGLVIDREADEADAGKNNITVYGVSSHPKLGHSVLGYGVSEFKEGVITGVAGVLLNEGKRRDFPVVTLLTEAHPDYPDARAAAKVIEVIDKMLPQMPMLDPQPLYEEAERIESQLKMIRKQTESGKKQPGQERPSMYG